MSHAADCIRTSGQIPLFGAASVPPKVVFVFMPGVLMETSIGFAPVIRILKAYCEKMEIRADYVCLDYEGDYLDVERVQKRLLDFFNSEYFATDGVILPIAASFSGMMLNSIYVDITNQYISRRPILIDAPFGATFAAPFGNEFAAIMGLVDFVFAWGPLVKALNSNKNRFTGRGNMPKAANIGNAGDFTQLTDGEAGTYQEYIDWVMARAKDGLYGQKMSMFLSMTGAMSKWDYRPFGGGVEPIYIACVDGETAHDDEVCKEEVVENRPDAQGDLPVEFPKNETVKQPDAQKLWNAHVPLIHIIPIASTHCGFLERPVAWRAVFEKAVQIALAGRL